MNSVINKYLNPKNDVAFKHIFGKPKNKEILIAMLNAVLKSQLHKPIKQVKFLKTSQEPELRVSKQSIVDVLCQDQDGCQYIIEMQVAEREGFEKRAQYYASKAYSSQARQGMEYYNLKEVIFLAFTDYILFEDKKDYKSEHVTLDKKTQDHNLRAISFTFVELPKFAKQCPKNISKLSLEEKFYYFLDKAEAMQNADLKKFIGDDLVIQKAFDALERFNWTESQLNSYESWEKNEWDHRSTLSFAEQKGKKEGREEGIKEGEERGREEGIKVGEKRGREEERRVLLNQLEKLNVSPEVIEMIKKKKY